MKDSFRTIVWLIIAIWLVELINIITDHSLVTYGILPRKIVGLPGIILHPFIHGSLHHIISNSIPMIVLSFIVALGGRSDFIKVTLFIVLTGGTLLWIFGRNSFHIGASLLIFGYFGFIIVNAIYKKTPIAILAALITIFLYGGMLYGIIPVDRHVSWEGHLFGLIAGITAARFFRK